MDPGNFAGGMGYRPNIFQGFPNSRDGGGGGLCPIAIFYRNLSFPRVGGPDLLLPPPPNPPPQPPPPPSICAAWWTICICPCVKHIKVTKNVADSQYSIGTGGNGHLKMVCLQNQNLYCIRSWEYLSLPLSGR